VPAYYLNKRPCEFDPDRAMLFQLAPTQPPRKWYLRLRRIDGTYYQESLRTADYIKAKHIALQKYASFLHAEGKGVVFGEQRFSPLFRKFIKKKRFKKTRKAYLDSLFTNYFDEFFGSMNVGLVNQKVFNKYIDFRVSYWSEKKRKGEEVYRTARLVPSAKSLKMERDIIIQFLRWLHSEEVIASVPSLQLSDALTPGHDVKRKKTRGKPIPARQLASIMAKLRWFAFKEQHRIEDPRHDFARKRLYYFALVATNFLMRPGTEMTGLRWKDLELVRSERSGLTIAHFTIRQGKTIGFHTGVEERKSVGTYRGTLHLLRWRSICREVGKDAPEDYVFPNWDGSLCRTPNLTNLFAKKTREWKLDRGPGGEKITLYSLRNTAISRRLLLSGWDPMRVAKAAGTSLRWISEAYADDQMVSPSRIDAYANTAKEGYTSIEPKEEDEIAALLKELGI